MRQRCLRSLISCLFLFMLNPSGQASGPYIRICFMSNCEYHTAGNPYYLCSASSVTEVTFYAYDPTFALSCIGGTFQWYRMVWAYCKPCGTNCLMWGYCGSAIEGATSSVYTVSEPGEYYCVYNCGSGERTTDTVQVIYHAAVPVINADPASVSKCEELYASFSCSYANARSTLWQEKAPGGDWSTISGEKENILDIVASTENDLYQYRCSPENACGRSYSAAATLDVLFEPDVVTHPGSITVCEDGTANFNTSATGDGISYHWMVSENGTNYANLDEQSPYSGTQTQHLVVSPADDEKDGNLYRCRIGGSCATVNTTAATLHLKFKPDITTNPDDVTACSGEKVSFSAGASGYAPLTYAWYKDNQLQTQGVDKTSYVIDPVSTIHAGSYNVKVTNECSAAGISSESASLQVKTLPQITSNPVGVALCEGDQSIVSFNSAAQGSDLEYFWQLSENEGESWRDLEDAEAKYTNTRTSSLSIEEPDAPLDHNLYRVRVEGYCEPDVYSAPAALNVNTAPVITHHPESMQACEGSDVTLSTSVTGSEPKEYLWKKDGISVTGWTGDSILSLPGVSTGNAGTYNVLVKNMCSEVPLESDDASLTVNIPPAITSHPQDVSLCAKSQPTVTFSTTVPGSGFTYRWESSKDGGETWTDLNNDGVFSNVTTNQLSVGSTADTMNQYRFRCKIVGICDPPVKTDEAVLTIMTAPGFITHPQGMEVCQGDDVTFSVEVEGTGPFQYKWRKGNAALGDWTSSDSYTLYSVKLDDYEKYDVVVKNVCSETGMDSEDAQLVVRPAPNVSLGEDRHLCPGKSMELDAGSGYAWYEWNTGEATRSITVTKQGSYKVTVADQEGCTNSDNVFIIVDPSIPPMDLGPDRSYCQGEQVMLHAGNPYSGYLWSDGSDSRSINVTSSGTYWVSAWNSNSVCMVSDTVQIYIAEPYDQERLCIVTVDMFTGKNLLVWEKTPDAGILTYNLWRETSIGEYEPIARDIPFDNLSVFTDTEVSPENRSYLYKITVTDTCRNESDLDDVPYHKPIFLKYVPSDLGVSLEWTDYKIEGINNLRDILTSYEIYRGTELTGLSYYTSVGSINDYLDTDPATATTKFYYRVAGVLSTPCYPSAAKKSVMEPVTSSMSNLEYNRGVGTGDLTQKASMLIYPNPLTDFTTIRFENSGRDEFRLELVDISGKVVLVREAIRENEIILNKGKLGPGIYQVQLSGKKLYRGILVVR